ncbi:MAG: hypothetical protein AABZ74_08315, partial [Cyanobacteriota bacterium]
MKNKFISLFSLSVVLFSCNTNNLNNNDFKVVGTVNNASNGQSQYKFDGMINRTDGAPVPVPTPTPTPTPDPNSITVYNATLFAGSPTGVNGDQNGQGSNALFSYHYNMLTDYQNNLYFISNGYLKKIDPLGNVTDRYWSTLDGSPMNSRIATTSIGFDFLGNMYSAYSYKMLKTSPDGNATTIYECNCGIPYNVPNSARIALDNKDNPQNIMFIPNDTPTAVIRKISLDGTISTFANHLVGEMISDSNGGFIVSNNFQVKRMSNSSELTTIAGSGIQGYVDSNLQNSQFNGISSIAIYKNNNYIVADSGKLRLISNDGNVSTMIINNLDPLLKYRFPYNFVYSSVVTDSNDNIYAFDSNHFRIVKLTPQNIILSQPKDNKNYNITTIAGDGNNAQTNGQGTNSSFGYPTAIAYHKETGNIFVFDSIVYPQGVSYGTYSPKIRKIDTSNNVNDFYTSTEFINDLALNPNGSMTIATGGGSSIQELDTNGIKITNNLNSGERKYSGIAKDSLGNLYSSDITYNIIRKNGNLFAGTLGQLGEYGFQYGAVGTAKFNSPQGLAVDNIGNVYVADTKNNCIRKVDPSGNTTTLAGSLLEGFKDGNGTNAKFRRPTNLAVDNLGYVYVSDTGNNRIRK